MAGGLKTTNLQMSLNQQTQISEIERPMFRSWQHETCAIQIAGPIAGLAETFAYDHCQARDATERIFCFLPANSLRTASQPKSRSGCELGWQISTFVWSRKGFSHPRSAPVYRMEFLDHGFLGMANPSHILTSSLWFPQWDRRWGFRRPWRKSSATKPWSFSLAFNSSLWSGESVGCLAPSVSKRVNLQLVVR